MRTAAFMNELTASPTRTTSLQRGYTDRQPSSAIHMSSAPIPPKTSRPSASGSAPIELNQARPDTSFETADLNVVKRVLIVVRLFSISPRNSDSRSLPDPTTASATAATAASQGVSSISLPFRELEIGDLLAAETAPDLPLGRHGRRLVSVTTDQVEQRGGELERAGLATLAHQDRHERRLGVGRRLLLVLAVVARAVLPSRSSRTRSSRRGTQAASRARAGSAPCATGDASRSRFGRGRARRRLRRPSPRRRSWPARSPRRPSHPLVDVIADRGKTVRSSTN